MIKIVWLLPDQDPLDMGAFHYWHVKSGGPVYVPGKPPCCRRNTTHEALSGWPWGCVSSPTKNRNALSFWVSHEVRVKCFLHLRHTFWPVPRARAQESTERWLEQGTVRNSRLDIFFLFVKLLPSQRVGRCPSCDFFFFSKTQDVFCVCSTAC